MYLYIWRGIKLLNPDGFPSRAVIPENAAMVIAPSCAEAQAYWTGNPMTVSGEPDHVYKLDVSLPARQQEMEFGTLVYSNYDPEGGQYLAPRPKRSTDNYTLDSMMSVLQKL